MMKVFDLLIKSIKDEKLYPMADFFDSLANRTDFVHYVDYLTKGISIGLEESGCDFPNSLDEYSIYQGLGFDGIHFYSFENEVSVDVSTFRKYLRIACDVYLQEHSEDRQQIEEYLARPQPPLEERTLEEWKRRKAAGEYPKPYSEFE